MGDGFYFIANNLALDFVNTLIVGERDEPLDLLRSSDDLVKWLSEVGLVPRKKSMVEGRHDQKLLERAINLRSELKKRAKAVSDGKRVPTSAIDAINDVLSRSAGHFKLLPAGSGYVTKFDIGKQDPPDPLLPVAQSAARLLSEGDLSLVRKCQREACVLYFYDTSKRHGRQWCSMSACGNRAKAAAHYKRAREK